LEQAVAKRQFREDLFYRLNVVRVHVPALRERREDVRLLANYFLKKFAKDQQHTPKSVGPAVIKALEKYHWPGNVRLLTNVFRRALVVAKGDAILSSDLPPEVTGDANNSSVVPNVAAVAPDGTVSEIGGLARQLFQWARRDPKLKVI